MFAYNPLMDNLVDLSDAQLLERMQSAHKHMNSAYAMGKGDMVQQLAVALEMCKSELSRRQHEKTKATESNGPDPFKSIDIG
jgi:hypothetical protein